MSLSSQIKQAARDLGFDAVGIAAVPDAAQASTRLQRLVGWLERGYHGTMAWMGRSPERRADPALVLAGCRSIICLGMNYFTGHRANEGPGYGRVARYAWGQDYHAVLGDRLRRLEARILELSPGAVTRAYVDTGPIMEKAWAERAGLGWIGKHSNLVSAEFGSWLVLGEVLTTLALEPDEPGTDLCGTCSLCIRACPTGAIESPFVVNATRCVSYLTIEYRGDRSGIPDDIRDGFGNKIFGCDDCLDVCPYNAQERPTAEEAFIPTPLALAPSLALLAEMDEGAFTAQFKSSPLRRAKHAGLMRNVSIAMEHQRLSSSDGPPLSSDPEEE